MAPHVRKVSGRVKDILHLQPLDFENLRLSLQNIIIIIRIMGSHIKSHSEYFENYIIKGVSAGQTAAKKEIFLISYFAFTT